MLQGIFIYSISLQPADDTPEVLAAYAKTYRVGPGWLFLTGRPPDIELLRHRLGFVDIDPVQDATWRRISAPCHRQRAQAPAGR